MNISQCGPGAIFLKASGALVVSFSVRAQGSVARIAAPESARFVDRDRPPTAASPPTAAKEELGQGISTAQQQLVAEELFGSV